MKILVTGGAGFIGSHIVDKIILMGHDCIVVDNLLTGKEHNVNPKAIFYKVDISDTEEMERIFLKEHPNIVNHHAAQVDVRKSVREPVYDAEVNILGSLNLMELSREYRVEKFIYASTGGAVYGEPLYLPVDEDHPIYPLAHYGVSKHTVEHYLHVFNELYGFRYTVLRYGNVYGPRQNPYGEAGVVAIFSEQMLARERPTIFGDGSKTRDYIFIDDVVDANILVMNNRGDNEVFNLGWGKEVSDQKIFEAVRDALKVDIKPIYDKKRPGELDRICLDNKKIKHWLDWQPKVSLEEGIARTTAWYKKTRQAEG
ncbi:MAG TPA: NAD-dependent epimerase/dehydratase family protein [Candidatus Brocadiia bacterium]|nr:NAD-dependent epimerase/dehydratase family protein [Planctomycetota bacterium]MDO8093866.1 NAD-dependent epimerase/dehydratase family protein [Candidatus Brocadiales bacterium]